MSDVSKKRPCFICDGSGLMCDICGESEGACRCNEPTFSDCQNCGGDGIAPLDKEPTKPTPKKKRSK